MISSNYVTEIDGFFEHHVSQYKQQSIRFLPKFHNISDSEIVGIRFSSSFRNAFGDEILTFDGDITERILPGNSSTARFFYVFENNPFINGEPYDKLLQMITGNTGSIITTITSLAFEGGRIVRF
jgi:hypothetical protein